MRLRTTLATGLLAFLPTVQPIARLPDAAPASAERIVANDNRIPAGRLHNGVFTLRLELRTGMFRPHGNDGPGVEVLAFGEEGRPLTIPGPLVRMAEGTIVAATIRNRLADSTLVLHGFTTRPGPADDTIQVRPGATRSVRFAVGRAGTYYYWGTTAGKTMGDDRWIDSQLSGGFIVDPAGTPAPAGERVFVMGLWLKPADENAGEPEREFMVINGKSWPDTERLEYAVGDTVRWRWLNPTSSSHPMHLHGFYYEVESRGSWAADTVYMAADRRLVVTELMPPGGTMTARWAPTRPGNWLFHCHFAFHITDEQYLSAPADTGGHSGAHMAHRMAGLVLGLHVSPAPGAAGTATSATTSSAVALEPARLRLLVQTPREPPDSAHLMGYVLQEGDREPAPDSIVIPGPTLVLERGRPVRITVVNRLAEPTAVHWHGIELESYPDGVPGWSGLGGRVFQPIAPGDSFTAAFTPPRAGTFIYHSHANELTEIQGGLYGALIVVEPGTTLDTATNRLVIVGGLFRHDSAFGVVNGRLDPAPIELRVGRMYRLRLITMGDARTFFALRRRPEDSSLVAWRAVAKDGADLPASQAVTSTAPLLTGPGETADFEYRPAEPGELSLTVDSPFAGWRLDVPVRITR
ncbi:MAG: multicopper oxidase domain-containing protein [Gemmatimonadales bacterium]